MFAYFVQSPVYGTLLLLYSGQEQNEGEIVMIIFIISLSKLVMLSVVPMGLVYVSLRAVIWAFAFVSMARRVFSKD